MTTLTELERLARAATPGPWVSKWYEGDDFPMIKLSNDTINDITRREDADYIAALSPERVLQLLDVIEAAKAIDHEMFNGMTPSVGSANKLKSALAALDKEQGE